MPVSVAIVSYGVHTPCGKKMQQITGADSSIAHKFFEPWDVRRMMWRDPKQARRYNVLHTDNADALSTQLALLDDSRFYDTVRCVCSYVEDRTRSTDDMLIVPLYCTSGNHRAHGVGKASADTLNRVYDEVGERKFNVKVFHCGNASAEQLEQTVVKQAEEFTNFPWTIAEVEEWGSKAAEDNSRAHRQVKWMKELALVMSGLEPEQGCVGADYLAPAQLSDDDDEAPVDAVVKPTKPKSKAAAMKQQQSDDAYGKADWKQSRRKSGPYARSDNIDKAKSESWTRDDDAGDDDGDDVHEAAASASQTVEAEANVVCAVCMGTGCVAENITDFATFERNPHQWRAFLIARGCDEDCLAQIFACAQTKGGYDEVMRIIHKLCKKSSGGYAVHNVNAFIVSSIKNFWRGH